jgi:adenosine deaminase
MEMLERSGVVLEVCPTSNLNTGVVKGVADMKRVFRTLLENGVRFTLNTDGPEMLKTNLRGEMEFLVKNRILDVNQVLEANRGAFDASFVE